MPHETNENRTKQPLASPGPERAVLQGLGGLVLALPPVEGAEVLEGGGDGGAVHLGSLVPPAILAVRGLALLAVLVLLTQVQLSTKVREDFTVPREGPY